MEFSETSFEQLPLAAKRRIDAVCERFERAWQAGEPRLESFCAQVPPEEQAILLSELLHIEVEFRRRAGQSPCAEDYMERFPQRPDVIRAVFPDPVRADTAGQLPDSATTMPSLPGRGATPVVPGYEILGELGRGGMGVVYKARHLKLNRMEALKFILAGPNAPERHQQRIREEARLVAHLRHPNIIHIYDIGEIDGQTFLALEYADGGSLRDRFDGKPLEPRAAALLLEPLARATQHAHRMGVIHRDIKPANVLLAIGGDSISAIGRQLPDWTALPAPADGADLLPPLYTCTPKLTDFGLARHLHNEPPRGEPNLAAGTPAYMAPEQAMGEEPGPAVDVWALGATLYELLTGRPPFNAPTPAEVLRDVLMINPPAPSKINPKVPPELDAICMKCLQKEPAERYPGARELAQDLRRFLAGEAFHKPRGGVLERTYRWARRRPLAAVLTAGLLLGAVAAAAAAVGAIIHARLG